MQTGLVVLPQGIVCLSEEVEASRFPRQVVIDGLQYQVVHGPGFRGGDLREDSLPVTELDRGCSAIGGVPC